MAPGSVSSDEVDPLAELLVTDEENSDMMSEDMEAFLRTPEHRVGWEEEEEEPCEEDPEDGGDGPLPDSDGEQEEQDSDNGEQELAFPDNGAGLGLGCLGTPSHHNSAVNAVASDDVGTATAGNAGSGSFASASSEPLTLENSAGHASTTTSMTLSKMLDEVAATRSDTDANAAAKAAIGNDSDSDSSNPYDSSSVGSRQPDEEPRPSTAEDPGSFAASSTAAAHVCPQCIPIGHCPCCGEILRLKRQKKHSEPQG